MHVYVYVYGVWCMVYGEGQVNDVESCDESAANTHRVTESQKSQKSQSHRVTEVTESPGTVLLREASDRLKLILLQIACGMSLSCRVT